MADSSHKATIVAAIIGLIGTLGATLISNWDKVVGRPEPAARTTLSPSAEPNVQPTRRVVASAPPAEVESAPPVKNVAGNWRDLNFPTNGSRITQDGTRLRFDGWGINGFGNPYQTTGTGTVNGDNLTMTYTARDRFGGTSSGSCSGTLSSDATRMTMTCTDTAAGTIVFTAIRQ